jgi:hypothetical protein
MASIGVSINTQRGQAMVELADLRAGCRTNVRACRRDLAPRSGWVSN